MLGRDIIIAIAICAVLAALLIVAVAIRVVKTASSTSNPLPPVQPLARHREQQLAKFESTLPRSQTWYGSQNHLAPNNLVSISTRGSRASLIAQTPSPADTESAASYSPSMYNQSLHLPSHSFEPPRPGSSSSLGSSEPGVTSPPLDPPPFPRARSMSSSPRRSRPLSVSSSHSTIYSKNSRHTLRGTPHGPHSQIQIILPAPLAADQPGTDASMRRSSRFDGDTFDRRSVVDKWLSPGTITPEEVISTQGEGRHTLTKSRPPPVPRVPSMFISQGVSDKEMRRSGQLVICTF